MLRYILKRIPQAIITLFIASVIVFILARVTGDPVALLLSDFASEEERARITQQLGLDKSLPEQYAIFISKALQGDLGNSVRGARTPAVELVLQRLPASIYLAGLSLLVGLMIGLPLGVLSAVWRGTIMDALLRIIALLGQATPVFWLGILMIYVFSVRLGWLPTSGYGKATQFVMPVFALSSFMIAAIMRLTRSGMLEVIDSEFIKLARIKGLPESTVIWKHALSNSLIPLITYLGTIFGRSITGAVVVETIFAWPGVGRLAYEAVLSRDFPVLQAIVLFTAASFLFINLVVDVLYAYVDPRIRYS
jgi:peptide/nickel transport system permease protein